LSFFLLLLSPPSRGLTLFPQTCVARYLSSPCLTVKFAFTLDLAPVFPSLFNSRASDRDCLRGFCNHFYLFSYLHLLSVSPFCLLNLSDLAIFSSLVFSVYPQVDSRTAPGCGFSRNSSPVPPLFHIVGVARIFVVSQCPSTISLPLLSCTFPFSLTSPSSFSRVVIDPSYEACCRFTQIFSFFNTLCVVSLAFFHSSPSTFSSGDVRYSGGPLSPSYFRGISRPSQRAWVWALEPPPLFIFLFLPPSHELPGLR